jgi:hypothetical protein
MILRFEFHKRGQLFIRTHNEPLPIAAMRVSNPDCSPVGIIASYALLKSTKDVLVVAHGTLWR